MNVLQIGIYPYPEIGMYTYAETSMYADAEVSMYAHAEISIYAYAEISTYAGAQIIMQGDMSCGCIKLASLIRVVRRSMRYVSHAMADQRWVWVVPRIKAASLEHDISSVLISGLVVLT
ncbi:hypothetical protein CONLIGDRAFT_650558 [Coniochaeta ligniaria NRRL 30616]|uniref:Uncharacterized protein n=1 Tax=Coniochaeta ligniaria NRRL 30616 TaxID=1408157 RepID=A0A1J7IZX4_9PEZI|nr:hypothetical protein CONLIGDRAFT_650558 [Coniochaeta ligniaria NRRL 30616]